MVLPEVKRVKEFAHKIRPISNGYLLSIVFKFCVLEFLKQDGKLKKLLLKRKEYPVFISILYLFNPLEKEGFVKLFIPKKGFRIELQNA